MMFLTILALIHWTIASNKSFSSSCSFVNSERKEIVRKSVWKREESREQYCTCIFNLSRDWWSQGLYKVVFFFKILLAITSLLTIDLHHNQEPIRTGYSNRIARLIQIINRENHAITGYSPDYILILFNFTYK
jgi:hypothetical protein